MALPEPPPNVPRIVEVQNPGTNHHVVYVRMPTNLASKFPDKPWGTKIEDIGLSTKDSGLYPGYTLVDVEPLKGSPDLYWIFQKLAGPIWTTRSQGQENLTPAKYRRLIVTTQTKQEVVPGTQPDAITGDLTQSVVQEEENTGKATKVNTSETIDENADPLLGSLTDTWGINTTEESLVTELVEVSPGVFERHPLTSGFGVKSSRVVPLGDGKAIKETEFYPPDDDGTDGQPDGIIYKLEDRMIDDATAIEIDIDKYLVDASLAKSLAQAKRAADDAIYPEIKAIDKWHSILITSKVDPSTIPAPVQWYETGNFHLPNKLVSAGVIWDSNSDGDSGASGVQDIARVEADKISWSAAAEATAFGSVTGRPFTLVESGQSGSANMRVTRTYHYGPPAATISAHVFKPAHGIINLVNVQAMHRCRVFAAGKGSIRAGKGSNYKSRYDTSLSIHQFGPVEHYGVSLVELGDSRNVTASYYALTGSLPGSGAYPAVTASINAMAEVSMHLPLSSTPLTTGQTFIANVSVKQWRFGWWIREVYEITIP